MPRWSRDEDVAVLDLYKRLLANERSGVPFNLADEILATPGIDKSPEAIRNRLQNVSAVLEQKGLPRLQKVAPWAKASSQTRKVVEASLPW